MRAFRVFALPRLERLHSLVVTDSIDDELGDIFTQVRQVVESEFERRRISRIVRPLASQIASYQAAQLNRQLSAVLGIDLVGNELWLERTNTLFVAENVALIKSLPSNFFTQLETRLTRHFAASGKFEEMAVIVDDQYSVAKNRTKNIATDQTQKYFSALNETRQTGLGIDKFVWMTEDDGRVRASHEALHGQVMDWNGSKLPGEEPGCRCEAQPYLEAFVKGI